MSEGLVAPPGRQGPGPVPGALVEALDLVLARRASGALPGERRAAGLGAGTELAQIRPYQVGDDVRRLDAAASARTGLPHVRDHVPERALTTWLLIDISASMAFGTGARLKADVAGGVAEVVGRLAVRRGGRVGALTCGAPVTRMLPPRGGRGALVALRRLLRAGVAPDGVPPAPDALAAGLRRAGRLARGPGLIVVVSDFREGAEGLAPCPHARNPASQSRNGALGEAVGTEGLAPWHRVVGALALRHDVLAVEVLDARELALPDAGQLSLVDPETGARIDVDTASAEVRRAFAAAELARRDALEAALRRARARHVVLDADGDWLRALGRGLR